MYVMDTLCVLLLTGCLLFTLGNCQGLSTEFAGWNFIASQTGNSITLSAASIMPSGNVTYNIINITFQNVQFPTPQCGDRYRRCTVSVFRDQSSSRLVAVVPAGQWAAVALFESVSSSLAFQEQYLIPLPGSPTCNLTSFFEIGNSIYGFCYDFNPMFVDITDEVALEIFELFFDYNQLNQASIVLQIQRRSDEISTSLSSTEFSSAFYLSCGGEDYVYWFDDGFLYDLARIDLSSSTLRREDSGLQPCYGVGLQRVIQFQANSLLAYCSNNTLLRIDTCGDTLTRDIQFTRLTTRYYCSGNESVFLEVIDNSVHVRNIWIPFPLDPTLPFIGDCVAIDGKFFFIVSSNDGSITLINVLQNSTTLLADNATVYHQVVQDRFVTFSDFTFSAILDLSCQEPATPIHVYPESYELVNFSPNAEFSCSTVQPTEPPTVGSDTTSGEANITVTSTDIVDVNVTATAMEMNVTITTLPVVLSTSATDDTSQPPSTVSTSTTVETTTALPETLNSGQIVGIVFGAFLFVILVLLLVLVLWGVVKFYCRRKRSKYNVEALNAPDVPQVFELTPLVSTSLLSSRESSEARSVNVGADDVEHNEDIEKSVLGEIGQLRMNVHPPKPSTDLDTDDESPLVLISNTPPTTDETSPVSTTAPETGCESEAATFVPNPPGYVNPLSELAASENSTINETSSNIDDSGSDHRSGASVVPPPGETVESADIPDNTRQEYALNGMPKLLLAEESDNCTPKRPISETHNDQQETQSSAHVPASGAPRKTMPVISNKEDSPSNVESGEDGSTKSECEMVDPVSALPDNSDTAAIVTSKFSSLPSTRQAGQPASSRQTDTPNSRTNPNATTQTSNSSQVNNSPPSASPSLPITFRNNTPPTRSQESPEDNPATFTPVQASGGHDTSIVGSQRSTVTGIESPLSPANFNVCDHEDLIRKRDKKRTEHMASKLEGFEEDTQHCDPCDSSEEVSDSSNFDSTLGQATQDNDHLQDNDWLQDGERTEELTSTLENIGADSQPHEPHEDVITDIDSTHSSSGQATPNNDQSLNDPNYNRDDESRISGPDSP